MKATDSRSVVRLTALTGILGALMLAFSYTEKMLTSLLPLPPGVKPGLANIIVMFACCTAGFGCAFLLTLIKSAFVLLTSGVTAGIISLSGGLLSVTATAFLIKKAVGRFSFTGISVLGALAHNAGQTLAACAVIGSFGYLYYFPVLVISAVVTGAVTGTILRCVLPPLKKLGLFDSFVNDGNNKKQHNNNDKSNYQDTEG